jgi:hypothetical protein
MMPAATSSRYATLSFVRTVNSGSTLMIGYPEPKYIEKNSHCLLLFVTPTVVPDPTLLYGRVLQSRILRKLVHGMTPIYPGSQPSLVSKNANASWP